MQSSEKEEMVIIDMDLEGLKVSPSLSKFILLVPTQPNRSWFRNQIELEGGQGLVSVKIVFLAPSTLTPFFDLTPL